jgi:electron-transferring-flavoprotein dehydrogenase
MPQWPMPRLMSNHGNFIGSLGDVCRYLGRKAEELGVEIYPGFPAAEVLVDGESRVVGVATGDLGIGCDGKPKDSFTRGMELRGRYTVFAEGARGNLTKQLIHCFNLDRGRDHQKYGIGIKELWQVAPEKHKAGLVQHSMGWPLPNHAGGGSWLYHFGDNLVSVGFVVHLNYQNPTLSPFDEFQRFKTHPMVRGVFEGAKRIGYGARAIMEGGWQAVPRLTFPGGCLVGDTAGFVNVPRIKGTHNAVLSGMLCAEHLFPALQEGRANDEVSGYEEAWRSSEIGRDLYRVRNVKPLWSRLGTWAGVSLGGLDMWLSELFGWSPFGTMRHGKPDHATLKPLAEVEPIVYPKPDGVLTFDRLSSVFLSNTNHEEDQPSHLVLADPSIPIRENLPRFGEPARLYCPAGVYEVVYGDAERRTDPKFVINAQNCVHCKTCDIKDPAQNINWVTPEGGGGPNYVGM